MRSTRGRSLYVVNPLEQIYEMKCRDNDIKVIPEIMEMFLKSQKDDEKLNLEYQNIKNLNAVGNALHGIIQLNLAKNQIQGLQQFAKRVNKSQLIHLDLSSNNIYVEEFLDNLQSNTLISLNLSNIRFSKKSVESLVRRMKTLEFLWIKNTQINEEKYIPIKYALSDSQIIYLDISSNSTGMKQLPNILHLNVAQNNIQEIQFQYIQSLQLNLSNNPLNTQTQQQLARAISKSGVQKLLLDNIIIDESFIQILNSNNLEYLSMSHCRLKEINKLLDRNQKLKYVNLSENFNLEIPVLKIETMVLDRCFYENAQLFQLFKQLYKHQGVKHLSIRDTFLTPELQQLIDDALNNNKQLQSLDCSCELIIQIKRKLKINNREHLQIQLNSFQIFDCQKEYQTLDVLTEKIKSKKFVLLEDLEQNISMVPTYSLSQSQQTQKLQNQLNQLKDYDTDLTFTMNDIEKKKNSLLYQSELDIVFFQNNLVKLRKETENFKIMQQNIAQKHKQYQDRIVQLQSQDQSAAFQLRKAQQIYNELMMTYNIEKEKQQLIIQEQIRLQQLQETLRKQKRPKSRSKSKN